MSTTPEKDTVYIDIDDEITAIIDKLQASQSKIVALVLPKRATVLQSIVNMKLLKRAAESAHKNLVLITSEAGLLPLAGAAGVHVAKNLQSKPEIPDAPAIGRAEDEVATDVPAETSSQDDVDKSQPIGALATKSTTNAPEETIEVDNSGDTADAVGAKAAKEKAKKDKKNKIPNFERFRKRLFLGGAALIGLIVFWFFALFVMPKASVVIKTDTTSKTASASFTASAGAQAVDEATGVVPAKAAELAKSDTQTAPATGQKDLGTKATGSVTITNCTENSVTIPAGTAVSANGLNFITQTALALDSGNFTGGGSCKGTGTHVGSTNVAAQSNGDQYNLSAQSYSVAGQSSQVKAQGSAMSGGSSKIVKVVAQSDVDAAKAKFTNNDDTAKNQLKKTLQDQGYTPLPDTFMVKDATTTVSPEVGAEGDPVTVSSKGTYHMLGVKDEDLKKIIDKAMSTDIDKNKQQIQDYGFKDATYKVVDNSGNDAKLTIDAQVAIGPKINVDELKQTIAGKKRGDTEDTIKALPGVKEVEVHYSPFWVSGTPKKTAKITIVLQKAQ